MKVLALAGSTREHSYNKKLVQAAADIARQLGALVTFIDLKDYPLPLYDADQEAREGMPENAKILRRCMLESRAILISSPEYNASIPAVLKNFLDWMSRSEEGKPSRIAYQGKKFAIMSTTPGKSGGERGLIHLRAIIENIGGEVLPEQITIPHASQVFNAAGVLENISLQQALELQMQHLLRR